MPGLVQAASYQAGPSTYANVIKRLKAGDTLVLESGLYRQDLILHNIRGRSESPIVIRGVVARQQQTVFWAQPGHNTISLSNTAYIELHDLVLDGRGLNVDAVKAEGPSRFAHHITLDGLVIFGYNADQQNVGISTKSPAWAWTVRNCIIDTAGTGMYFGQSDGSAAFFDGLIEHNVILDTTGYNIEIKHQKPWPELPLDGPRTGTTIVRYNVFSKARNGSRGAMARPNVLLDHWPEKGMGSGDIYQVYGNFFYENPTERLFQGEGNIALYDNLFVNDFGDAISIQRHHGPAKHIEIFDNTVIARGAGIMVRGVDPAYAQRVFGNAVFAASPLWGGRRVDNTTDSYARAADYLARPNGTVPDLADAEVELAELKARLTGLSGGKGSGLSEDRARLFEALRNAQRQLQDAQQGRGAAALDLYPRPGKLQGRVDTAGAYDDYLDAGRDFNGDARNGRFRGAYAGEGANPGWSLRLAVRP